ncbi:MAG: hypothetical protein JWQ47_1372 [Glaciihabitans sp.]|nr:hypothetical protein [Glaciihabitans sp.]
MAFTDTPPRISRQFVGAQNASGQSAGTQHVSDKAAGVQVVSAQLAAAATASGAVSTEVTDYRVLDDAGLVSLSQTHAAAQKSLATVGALIAGEIARRSDPSLGAQGLAQRAGHRTPEQFLKHTTGIAGRDATTAVRTGVLLAEIADDGVVDAMTGEVSVATQPWLRPVALGIADGILSLAAADGIRGGLGHPNSAVTAAQLEGTAARLVAFSAAGMDADRLARRARELRDELDLDGVALREEERRDQRVARLFDLPNGMTRLIADLDPESAIPIRELFDRSTSPKRGAVRFVGNETTGTGESSAKRHASAKSHASGNGDESGKGDASGKGDGTKDDRAKADSILADTRSTGQLFADALVQLLKLGADRNPNFLLGSGAPVIRIAATRKTVETRTGLAHFEGQHDAISVTTLERLGCEGRYLPVSFDESGVPIDVGREQRLFGRRQREALALKWGGCMADCDRPPSWCEAHHIQFWERDGGKSNVADGILLCRHHHLLFHNNGWEIVRDPENRYWIIPPTEQDPSQTPVPIETKSRAMRDLELELEHEHEHEHEHERRAG